MTAPFALILGFPFGWMLVTAFKRTADLYDPDNVPIVFNDPPTFEHLRRLFGETSYLRWCWNTALVGTVVVALTLVLAVPAAHALARTARPAVRRIGTGMFLSYLVPPTVLFLPLVRLVSELGLQDSLWSLILVYPSFTVPCATWLLMGFFKALPRDLEDAALVDGCTRWSALRTVVVPAALPGVAAAAIVAFALATNEFTYALAFITSSAGKTLSVGVPSDLVRGDVAYWGSVMAGALIPSLVVGALYAACIRRFVAIGATGATR